MSCDTPHSKAEGTPGQANRLSGHGLAKDEFRGWVAEKIREKLPSSEIFGELVPKEISDFGDEAVLATRREDGYNVPLDREYAMLHKYHRRRFIYHMYISYPEHGAELAAAFRENDLPFQFDVFIRATAVKWHEGWPQPKEMILQETSHGLIGRTVEYALVFHIESLIQAENMIKIVDEYFTLKTGQASVAQSWEIPDVRVTGMESVAGMDGVVSNHYLDDAIMTLAHTVLPMVEYKVRILVNRLFYEVIK
jgi:hypothetical protein